MVYLTYTVIFPGHVFQVVAILALAVVAAKGVDTLPVVRAKVLACHTLIDVCNGEQGTQREGERESLGLGWLY